MPTFHDRRAALVTLGCKVNQAESEALGRRLSEQGLRLVPFDGSADLYIINTCTVTATADHKSRQLIRRARRHNPSSLVIVTGCYASVHPFSLRSMAQADLVVSNDDKGRLADLALEALGQAARTLSGVAAQADVEAAPHGRTRAFVKAQDGCADFCAYCIVPYARGRPTSLPTQEIVSRIGSLASQGCQEVVLSGVHLGTYGADQDHSSPDLYDLRRLIVEILRDTAISRLRLSSLEPQDVSPGLFELWRNPRLCRHLHLPLQSGCNRTLARMRRRYTCQDFASLVEEARRAIPGVAITTDLIAGFPGESPEDFLESLAFIEGMGFARAHVFPYSPRPGTLAASLPDQVPEPVKRERCAKLRAVSQQSAAAFRRGFLGQTLEVLWEERAAGDRWSGLTDNYLRVSAESALSLTNRIIPTLITALEGEGLNGSVLT
ncbi:MAG: tRNA (N(6)-L-threonylcarbamoyladenosine(37)-C(2))-methylthiotransferase MtaB [Chloroflexota bacterium]